MHNVITGNYGCDVCPVSYGRGGGVYLLNAPATAVISSNLIANNVADESTWGQGGGIMLRESDAQIISNTIEHNRAGHSAGDGGGIYVLSGTARIERNTIASNRGTLSDRGLGGGLVLDRTRPWLESNVILDNVAAGGTHGLGGGVVIGVCPVFTMTNNIVARNGASEMGSGVLIGDGGAGVLAHNTIAENQAGDGLGIYVGSGSDAALMNNIIVSHWQGIANSDPGGSIVTATHTLFEGNGADYGPGVTSSHEISGLAALLADYHLDSTSNGISQALALSWVTRDIDGDPRPTGAVADVGADEYVGGWLYLPLVVRNAGAP